MLRIKENGHLISAVLQQVGLVSRSSLEDTSRYFPQHEAPSLQISGADMREMKCRSLTRSCIHVENVAIEQSGAHFQFSGKEAETVIFS